MVSMPSDSGITSSSSSWPSLALPASALAWIGRAQGHHLVGVDVGEHAHVTLFAEELADRAAHRRHARGAADHDHAEHVAALHAGVAQHLAQRGQRALEQRPRQRLELLARHVDAQVAAIQRAMQRGHGHGR